jgi:hypothetical protein
MQRVTSDAGPIWRCYVDCVIDVLAFYEHKPIPCHAERRRIGHKPILRSRSISTSESQPPLYTGAR